MAHPAYCTMGTGSFLWIKSGRGVTLTPNYLLVPWSRKSRAITLLPLWAYGLYRATVPVQYSYNSAPPMGCTACTEPQCPYSTAIPLLPLWALRHVQSLSACTVGYISTSPIGRTACTEPQCLYSTAISLQPLWTVRPVQSLSACTVQLNLYSPYGPYGLYRASVPVQGCTLPFFTFHTSS